MIDPYALMALAGGLGVIWAAAVGVALHRNERVTVDAFGHTTMHLVDFGCLAVTGVAICLMMIVAAVWFGLTVN